MFPVRNLYTAHHMMKFSHYSEYAHQQTPIGFIGAGKMAQAIAGGFISRGLMPGDQIYFTDPDEAAGDHFKRLVPGAVSVKSTCEIVKLANVIILAVKPTNIGDVANSLIGKNKENTLFISILAGITLTSLYNYLQTKRVVRVMPNIACLIGEAASAYALGSDATRNDGDLVKKLFEAVGIAKQVKEKNLDAVTSLSGSGPAYVFEFIEALTDGGVLQGLTREVSQELAIQTILGAALLVRQTAQHPSILKNQVTSPGGTTAVGLQVLQRGGFAPTIIDAMIAVTKKSEELGRS